MRFTKAHYERAIRDLTDAMTQLEPNGNGCHCCGDSGHQAFECGWNPLVAMALCEHIASNANNLHDKVHAQVDDRTKPLTTRQLVDHYRLIIEEHHEFFHYLAGHNFRMGYQEGPARVRPPKDD